MLIQITNHQEEVLLEIIRKFLVYHERDVETTVRHRIIDHRSSIIIIIIIDHHHHHRIHAAARSKSIGCIKALIDYKSRLDLRRNDGWTALHNAVMRRDYEISHLLLEKHPILVLLGDENGTTPLDLALKKNVSDDIIQLLKDKRRWCVENTDTSKIRTQYKGKKAKRRKSGKKKSKIPKFMKNIGGGIAGVAGSISRKLRVKKKLSGNVRQAAKKAMIRRVKSKKSNESLLPPKQWIVKLFDQDSRPPVMAQSLLNSFQDLMKHFDDDKVSLSHSKPKSNVSLSFERVKKLLSSPFLLQKSERDIDDDNDDDVLKQESSDQTYRDLRREVIVINGQLIDRHIGLKEKEALCELRNAINMFMDCRNKRHIMEWILRSCTRTIHGGDVHAILHELVNGDPNDTVHDLQTKALMQALENGDISQDEFRAIQLKSTSMNEMSAGDSSSSLSSRSRKKMHPIVPSHYADEALTQVIISANQQILILASSAFDVGIPSKFVFQTTLEMKLNLKETTKLKRRISDRKLIIRLHKTHEEVKHAISKNMGVNGESKSLPVLVGQEHSLRSRLGSDVEKEMSKLRDEEYSVTPLLDAARELQARIQKNEIKNSNASCSSNQDQSINERRNQVLRDQIETLIQERDAALSLLLRAGERQAELLRIQKDNRRKADLVHSREIRSLREALEEKEISCETLRGEVRRLRKLI